MTEEQSPYTPEQLQTALHLCGNHAHAENVRLVAAFIAEMQKACAALASSFEQQRALTDKLDRSWGYIREYTISAFREALEMPDSDVPTMLTRITQLKERAGIGVVHDGRICPCSVCEHLRKNPLRVWHDDGSSYAIAYSRDDLALVLKEADMIDDADTSLTGRWYELAPKAHITIKVFSGDRGNRSGC